jgi:hypothetical protein
MNNQEMEEFINSLNENITFRKNTDIKLTVKKDIDTEPRTIMVNRVFKNGKITCKIVD